MSNQSMMFECGDPDCVMDKEDARNQTLEQLRERRKQVSKGLPVNPAWF